MKVVRRVVLVSALLAVCGWGTTAAAAEPIPDAWKSMDLAALTAEAQRLRGTVPRPLRDCQTLGSYVAQRYASAAAEGKLNIREWLDLAITLSRNNYLPADTRLAMVKEIQVKLVPDAKAIADLSADDVQKVCLAFTGLEGLKDQSGVISSTWVQGSDKYKELSLDALLQIAGFLQKAGDAGKGARARLVEYVESKYLVDAGIVVAEKAPVKIDIVDPAAFGGTFHSHNQKVLRNDNGTFMTYNGNGNWYLMRSADGDQTFRTVYRSANQTSPPPIETDSKDHVYLMHPVAGGVKFLCFTAANGYTSPDITKVYKGSFGGGKFAMAYDPGREHFYYASRGGYVLTIDKTGNLLRTQRVWRPDEGTGPQYPHLFLDADGTLHHAMTMTPSDNNPWYDLIRYVKSTDGGASWQAMDGTALSIPTSCGVNGPSTLITLLDGDESTLYNTWLCSMHPKAGKVHFYYRAEVPGPDRIHYMRFNARTGAREIDSWTDWNNEFKGETISFASLFGAFASDPEDPSGPLYFVSKDRNSLNLAALVSFDKGSTWHDYARATVELWDPGTLGRVGCSRVVTSDGKVIGSFRGSKGGTQRAFYFEFPACSRTGVVVHRFWVSAALGLRRHSRSVWKAD